MSAKKERGVDGSPAAKKTRASANAAMAADSSMGLAEAEGGRGSASPSSGVAAAPADPFVRDVKAYESWKDNLPLLYDCFIHSNLEWPSYACAWGPVLPENAPILPVPVLPTALSTNLQQPPAPGTPGSAAGAAAQTVIPCLTGAALTPRLYHTSYVTQNFYLSRSTDSKLEKDKWIGSPNMLLKAEIYYPNQYRSQDISKITNFDEDQRNPCLIIKKKIVHPGEINRIKVVPQYPDLIATHTDSPLVYVWNTNSQPSRRSQLNTDPSVPDLTLQGHVEREDCNTLYYALDCSKHNPFIISGGSDQKICLWSIADYCSTLFTTAHVEARAAAAMGAQAGVHASGVTSSSVGSSPSRGAATHPTAPSKGHIERLLSPRIVFSGHTAQVEEVCFHPHHQELLCSVGDDKRLMVWDMRLGGSKAALKLWTTHTDDVNAVHWNTVNDNLLVTGSSDHSVKLFDLRRVANNESFTKRYSTHASALRSSAAAMGETAAGSTAVVHTFLGHRGNVTNVQWHSNGDYFASGSDDGDLCVWSIRGLEELQQPMPLSSTAAKVASEAAISVGMDTGDSASATPASSPPPAAGQLPPKPLWDGTDGQPAHLLFRHSGHRTAVVNFAWNPFVKDGWTLASLSDDSADETLVGGGRLHVWRVTDLLHRDHKGVEQEFAANAAVLEGKQEATAAAANAAAAAAAANAGAAAVVPAPSATPPPVSPMRAETPPSHTSSRNSGSLTGAAAAGSDAPLPLSDPPSADMPVPDPTDLAAPAPMQLD